MGKDNSGCFYGVLYKHIALALSFGIVVEMEYDELNIIFENIK